MGILTNLVHWHTFVLGDCPTDITDRAFTRLAEHVVTWMTQYRVTGPLPDETNVPDTAYVWGTDGIAYWYATDTALIAITEEEDEYYCIPLGVARVFVNSLDASQYARYIREVTA